MAHGPAKSEVFAQLGEELRCVRIGQGLSAGELARRCGLSRSMLSRIENGQTSPSVDTLQSLAEALEVSVARFFCRRNGRPDLSFVPAGAGIRVDRMGEVAGFRYELLGHLLSGNLCVEPYLVRLQAGAPPFADFQQPGLQFVYLLSGRLRYRHGARVLEMGPGDALLFEGRAPHGVEAVLAEPVSYLAVTLAARQ
ncbi:helix-turn-helix domain-containing protein [Variovorax sp.]|uniref:helix-turn-helix domain-containing protein n=1 Tax=Variovorax sp. TaxID=1871043 RepID=UPI0037DA467A